MRDSAYYLGLLLTGRCGSFNWFIPSAAATCSGVLPSWLHFSKSTPDKRYLEDEWGNHVYKDSDAYTPTPCTPSVINVSKLLSVLLLNLEVQGSAWEQSTMNNNHFWGKSVMLTFLCEIVGPTSQHR